MNLDIRTEARLEPKLRLKSLASGGVQWVGRGGRDVRLGGYDSMDEWLYTALMSGKSEMTSSWDQDWVGVTYFVLDHPQ